MILSLFSCSVWWIIRIINTTSKAYLKVKLSLVIGHVGYATQVAALVEEVAFCFGIGDQSPNGYFYSPDNKLFFTWYFLLIISQSF